MSRRQTVRCLEIRFLAIGCPTRMRFRCSLKGARGATSETAIMLGAWKVAVKTGPRTGIRWPIAEELKPFFHCMRRVQDPRVAARATLRNR